jgi:fructose-1,6-bisphosphatase
MQHLSEENKRFVEQYRKHNCNILHVEIDRANDNIKKYPMLKEFYELEIESLNMCKKVSWGYENMKLKQQKKFDEKFDKLFHELLEKSEKVADIINEKTYLDVVNQIDANYDMYKDLKKGNVILNFYVNIVDSFGRLPNADRIKQQILFFTVPEYIYKT